jgi:hypothetical protein
MIQMTKGATQPILLTLTEKETTFGPSYWFIFTNRSSNEEVSFVLPYNTDISNYKERYNKFVIVTNQYFAFALNGQYTYNVYQKADPLETNPLNCVLLENGIMELEGADFAYTTNTTTDTYKIRQ